MVTTFSGLASVTPYSNHKSPYMNTFPTIPHIDARKASVAMLPREDGQQYQYSLFPFVLAAMVVVYMYKILSHLAKAATESDTACFPTPFACPSPEASHYARYEPQSCHWSHAGPSWSALLVLPKQLARSPHTSPKHAPSPAEVRITTCVRRPPTTLFHVLVLGIHLGSYSMFSPFELTRRPSVSRCSIMVNRGTEDPSMSLDGRNKNKNRATLPR